MPTHAQGHFGRCKRLRIEEERARTNRADIEHSLTEVGPKRIPRFAGWHPIHRNSSSHRMIEVVPLVLTFTLFLDFTHVHCVASCFLPLFECLDLRPVAILPPGLLLFMSWAGRRRLGPSLRASHYQLKPVQEQQNANFREGTRESHCARL